MITELDYILINGERVYRPLNFAPTKEDIYKGEYTTCTGKLLADRVGWKFADMTFEWDGLPQAMVDVLINMSGECTLVFDDLDGNLIQETIVRASVVGLRHRQTVRGEPYWIGVQVSIKFIDSHTED